MKEYFKLNGVHYPVAEGARHELVYSRLPVEPRNLRRGLNRIELLSDTEHHGIEVIYPGPALAVRYWALQMFVPAPGHEWGVFKESGLFGDWLYDHSIGLLGKPWASHWGRGFPFPPMWTHAARTMLGVFATYVLMGRFPGSRIAPQGLEPARQQVSGHEPRERKSPDEAQTASGPDEGRARPESRPPGERRAGSEPPAK